MIAAGMTMLMGLAGLALDLGYMEYYRRRAQVAADAGAMGGVRELVANGSGSLYTAARQDVTTNGFTDGVSGATVTVNHPPVSGPYAGDTHYVEVLVSKQIAPFFMGMLKAGATTIRTRSVGGAGASPYCIIALDRTADSALNVWGNAQVLTPGCAVISDSNSNQALTVGNSACITAKEIDVVGLYTGSCVSPAPNTGVRPVDDPFSMVSAPTVAAGCTQTNFSANKDVTLSPGVYCGGIKISGNGHTIRFQSGLYVIKDGGMQISGGNNLWMASWPATTDNGLTFYNTATAAKNFGDVKMTGTANIHLWAPKTQLADGSIEGILYFQDRAYTGTGSNFLGDSTSTIDGALYSLKGNITFSGNSSTNGYTDIVADTVTFTGDSIVRSDYSTLADGPPMRSGAMVE